MFNTSLKADNLSASRGGFALFENISFAVLSGQALRVTGPNGSGKTTLLRCLAGFVRADSGSTTMPGENMIHYLGHLNGMKPQLTVAENLNFWAALQDGTTQDGTAQNGKDITPALETLNLTRLVDLPFGVLSSGQKRRAAFARILLSSRPVWLLDEPTVGLDMSSNTKLEIILENHLSDGGIIIAATHTPLGTANWHALDLEPVQS